MSLKLLLSIIQTIVWQEIFDNNGILHPETIIDVWKGWGRGWQYELDLVCMHIC